MSFLQPLTVVIHCHGFTAHKSQNVIVGLLSKKLDFKTVKSIQFIPGGRIRVTFTDEGARNRLLTEGTMCMDGIHHFDVTESDSPNISVFVHYLPMEAGEDAIRVALRPFGDIIDISHQRFPSFRNIATGTRIVKMSLDSHIPFEMTIHGYPCRVWYRGQPVKCVICKGAHKAAECPDKNKCRRCHQAGHVSKDCTNAWGTTPPNQDPPAPPRVVPVNPPPAPGPSVSVAPPVAPTVDLTAPAVVTPVDPPPPLMSIVVPDHPDQSISEESLFTDSDSQSTEPPTPSQSQSILRHLTTKTRGFFRRSGPKSKDLEPEPGNSVDVDMVQNNNVDNNVDDPNVVDNLTVPNVDDPKVVSILNVVDPKVVEFNVDDPKVVELNVDDPKVVKTNVEGPKVVEPNVNDPKMVITNVRDPKMISPVADPNVIQNSDSSPLPGESDPVVVPDSIPLSGHSEISMFTDSDSPPSQVSPYEVDIGEFTSDESSSPDSWSHSAPPPPRAQRATSPVRADGRSRSPIEASARHSRLPRILSSTPRKYH